MNALSNRRDFLTQSTFAVAAAALSGAGIASLISAEVQAGESKKKDAGGEKLKAFAKAVARCKETGELCLAHCARELSAGNTEMAKCHASVQSMLAVCDAALKLVAVGSAQARKAVELCAAVCKECAESCEEHKAHFSHGMHLECKDCGEACREMEKACKAWLA
jgi:Cys-rich four helix bundle protein (predicted Tat secretion target)